MMKLRATLAALILAMPFTAQAIPLTYDVTLEGGFGSGSFAYDAEVPSLFDFNISFATFTSNPLSLRLISESGSAASFFFEILTGEDVDEARCSDDGACSFGTLDLIFGIDATFGRAGDLTNATFLDQNGEQLFSGGFSARQRLAEVTEPAALALFGLGLLALWRVVLQVPGRAAGAESCFRAYFLSSQGCRRIRPRSDASCLPRRRATSQIEAIPKATD
jgi:PEP-CTERM motif